MKRILTTTALALALGFAAAGASAQYTGPSTVPAMTVKALQADGKDDQPAVLRGKIVSSVGHERYLFSDGTGQMQVKIKARLWPAQKPVDAQTTVELVGEYDKELIGESHFDVKEIRLQ
ncbi:YgiW/YdeI family stress tolerance OB fold protein [Cupriavidus sp. TMH.W2]|uniref:YgiW/YdeI family stress tolerance OB fold protein n=1 Tax=Cupriavidus sp. TMH.W2 TaxID=3434465 RepID=UPI003D786716